MANNSAMVTARLREDVKAYGRKGSIVPVARGEMRNRFFPSGTADYVTLPELRKLRLSNTAVARDFNYGLASTTSEAMAPWQKDIPGDIKKMSNDEVVNASAFQKKVEVERLSPERGVELLEAFVRPRLEFYRQPIIEEKKEEEMVEEVPEPERKPQRSYGGGAGAELLAARMGGVVQPRMEKGKGEVVGPQAIYGSVSPLDVLQAVRAAMAENDEAKRVVLSEQDVQFVDLPETEGETAKVVKHVGDFAVEINLKGADTTVRRVVRVIPQEL
ncbi:uncharacterized protein LTR77_005367 [Saxophila tyrrhenica]|uniref:Ribosomal protein L9 domain-containing protein n=1 Tax=Saxophila tyrrhenica TaxID=1690608 RepID=A0AAV9P8W2_9PEZI|nr:hypothetical protein LTR77_005367 [Saxophila tyrrhenica]